MTLGIQKPLNPLMTLGVQETPVLIRRQVRDFFDMCLLRFKSQKTKVETQKSKLESQKRKVKSQKVK